VKFQHHTTSLQTTTGRAGRWRDLATEHGLSGLDRVWADLRQTNASADFSTAGYVVGLVSVPKPPPGYLILAEGYCAGEWSTGSALDCYLNLESATAAYATAHCVVDSSAGSVSGHIMALVDPLAMTNIKLVVRYNAGRTTLTVGSRGLVARYVVEG